MDISMVSEFEDVVFQRENSKDEVWLWTDWKDDTFKLGSLDQAKTALEAIKTAPPPADTAADL